MSRKAKIIIIFSVSLAITLGLYFKKDETSNSPTGYSYYQKGEYKEAVEYFREYAEHNSQSAFSLAMMYWEGVGVEENRLVAQEWLTKSANAENKNAFYNLGYLRYHGLIKNPSDDIKGLSSLSKAVILGSSEAEGFLREINANHKEGIEKYTLLPIYGEQTWTEKKATLRELEKLAEAGNREAIYQYLNNPGSTKRSLKTKGYLQPFIENKDPEFMYLKYKLVARDINLLLGSANSNYPDAVYFLYQVYHGDEDINELREDPVLADIYLQLSADLEHHDGLIKKIEYLMSDYNYSSRYFRESPIKYIDKLLEKYPNSHQAIITVAKAYSVPNSPVYHPDKAFELMNKAYEVQPSAEAKLELADKYAYGIGVKKDLKKAIDFLKENIANNELLKESQSKLVKIYFEFDISNYIGKEEIINILKNHVESNVDYSFNQDYSLAHYYADILLEQDPIKNSEYAFSLYEKAKGYFSSAKTHQAMAEIKYHNKIDEEVFYLIINDLNSDFDRHSLTEKERKEGYDILLKYGMDSPKVVDFIIEKSLYNDDVREAIQPILNINKDIAFKYIVKNIINESVKKNVNEDVLKNYYKNILELAELGSIDAMKFIVKRGAEYDLIQGGFFYNIRLDRLANITLKERFTWHQKCANLGDNVCLQDFLTIYHGENEYVNLKDPDFKYYEWDAKINGRKNNYINEVMKEEDSDKKWLSLAELYYHYDPEKSLFYAEKAYDLGNEKASQYIYNYYMDSICEDKNNINKAADYLKKWLNVSNISNSELTFNQVRLIAFNYLNAPCVIEQDLDKAIEWYQLSLHYPYDIDDDIYSALDQIYKNEFDNQNHDPITNIYISTLKKHNDYMLEIGNRLGKMRYAEPVFLNLYKTHLLKRNAKEAYFYAILLKMDVTNIAMFYSIPESERQEIEFIINESINKNKGIDQKQNE